MDVKTNSDIMIEDTALVLEGGGMRGIFTIGVLDALMDHGIRFPYVVGVSAGACNACSYLSKQRGRARFSNIDMMEQYDYTSIGNLIRQGNIFDTKLLYDRLPNEIYPFDYNTFFNSPTEFEMVVTNCRTGKAEYLSEHSDPIRTMAIVLATSTLPYVGRIVDIDGEKYLDGGITDSIPIEHAFGKGYSKAIVVTTRNHGYRKPQKLNPLLATLQSGIRYAYYHKYPKLRESLAIRGVVYNSQLQLVEDLEAEGRIKVIRPEKPIVVDRIEKNVGKLQKLYEEGYRIGDEFCKREFRK